MHLKHSNGHDGTGNVKHSSYIQVSFKCFENLPLLLNLVVSKTTFSVRIRLRCEVKYDILLCGLNETQCNLTRNHFVFGKILAEISEIIGPVPDANSIVYCKGT